MLTSRVTAPPPYVGVDLTDATCSAPRPTDVCGLRPTARGLEAELWTWTFVAGDATAIDVRSLLPEIRAARGVVIDGPQALADGAPLRVTDARVGSR
jgi:hypothetical protein